MPEVREAYIISMFGIQPEQRYSCGQARGHVERNCQPSLWTFLWALSLLNKFSVKLDPRGTDAGQRGSWATWVCHKFAKICVDPRGPAPANKIAIWVRKAPAGPAQDLRHSNELEKTHVEPRTRATQTISISGPAQDPRRPRGPRHTNDLQRTVPNTRFTLSKTRVPRGFAGSAQDPRGPTPYI